MSERTRTAPTFWMVASASLAALALAGHHGILEYGLTDIDTFMILTEARVDAPGDLAKLATGKLTGGRAGLTANFYRPVAMLGFAAERALFDWRPLGYHTVSLAGHWLCGMLVCALGLRLAERAGLRAPRAFALSAAAVFTAHPVSVEVVPAIARQPDVLVTALFLASLLLVDRAWTASTTATAGRRASVAWWAAFFFAFALTLGAKEPGALLLLVAPVWALGVGPLTGAGRRLALLVLPSVAITVAFLWLRGRVLDEVLGGYHVDQPLATMAAIVANGIWLDLLVPGYAAEVERIVPELAGLTVLGSGWFWVPLAGAIVALAGWMWSRSSRASDGLLAIVGFVSFVLAAHALLFWITRVYDRRLLYTAAAFWSLLPVCVAWWCAASVSRRGVAKAWGAAVGALLLGFSLLFAAQSPVVHRYEEWKSSGDAAHQLTEAIVDDWRALPLDARVAIANLPGGFDLDPMRATPYAGISSTNSPGIASLQAWLDDQLPEQRIRLHALGIHRFLEPFAGFRHRGEFRDGWLAFDVPASAAVLDRRFAEVRGFRLRDAGPNRVAIAYRDHPAPSNGFLLLVDGDAPVFVPLRVLDGGGT